MTNELDLPEGWEVKKLGDVFDKKSSNVSKNKIEDDDGDYPIFGAKGLIKNVSFYHQDKNYIAIIKDGAGVGRLSIYEAYSSVIGTLQYLIPKDCLDINFAYYFLLGMDFNKYVNGSTIPHIYFKDYKNENILIPSIPEQKRIVAILDDAFESIAKAKGNAEKNLKNANEIFESYLQSVFENKGEGWEEKTLGTVCKISSKLIDPREKNYIDLCHVGAGNIESITGRLINLKTSKEEKLISGKFTFDNSMVLYSKIRPYLVKVVRPDFAGICSADIYPLKPVDSTLDRNYLYFLLLTKNFTDFAIKGSARAGMPKVNRKHLFSYSTFFPILSEQKSIIVKLDALSAETKKLEAIYTQKLADLEELKKSILQKAFNGELTEAETSPYNKII